MVDLTKYERIVEMYTQPLYKYRYCKLQFDKALTEETVNDVMLILFEKWDKLDTGDNIRAWLYRTADNCIKHSLRKHNKFYSHNTSLEDELETNNIYNIQYHDEYFDNHSLEEEYINRIYNSLPDEYKEIFKLRYIDKKTISETAKIMGISYSTLHLRLTKIEAIVKKEIKKIFC